MATYPPTALLTIRDLDTGATYRHVSKYRAERMTSVPMKFIDFALNGSIATNEVGHWSFELEQTSPDTVVVEESPKELAA